MNVFAGWHVLLIGFLVLAIAAIIAALILRRQKGEKPGLENAGLLRFVAGLALIAAILAAAGTVFGVIATLAGQPTTVDVPVSGFVPTLPAGVSQVDGPTASIDGGADHLELTIAGLSLTTRILLSLGTLFGGATFVTIALLVRRLARSAITDDAYRGVASQVLWISASVLAVGTFVQSVLTQFGAYGAGVEALQITGYAATGSAGEVLNATDRGLQTFGWPDPSFALSFEFTPLLIALALACIAAIFREGERLRIRAERAEADVAGLV